jgi:hypothetical protein
MQNNPFYLDTAQSRFNPQEMMQMGGQLGGLMNMNQSGAQPQPGGVNAPAMGGMTQTQEPMQDFFSMLASNISRNFGST